MNVVAILAGGIGSRISAGIPKQFIEIAGKTLIEHTLDCFAEQPEIDEIMVVSHRDFVSQLENMRRQRLNTKWRKTVVGGAERYLSSYAAICACPRECTNLCIHDAARPFVSQALISRLLNGLKKYDAVVPVLPVADTLLNVENEVVTCAIPRKNVQYVQTPQCFCFSVIQRAFAYAIKDVNCQVTDDCSVILQYLPQVEVHTVMGDVYNKKMTYYSDIELFNKIFKEKNKKS